jgi:Flp pilus assembly pilin Flp
MRREQESVYDARPTLMARIRNGRREKEPRMFDLTKRLGNEVAGGTSIEYGLIAAGIAVGITMAVNSLGSNLKSTLADITLSPEGSSTASGRPAIVSDGP